MALQVETTVKMLGKDCFKLGAPSKEIFEREKAIASIPEVKDIRNKFRHLKKMGEKPATKDVIAQWLKIPLNRRINIREEMANIEKS